MYPRYRECLISAKGGGVVYSFRITSFKKTIFLDHIIYRQLILQFSFKPILLDNRHSVQ